MKITDTQRIVLQRMNKGHSLESHFTVEGGVTQFSGSGWIYDSSHYSPTSGYRSILPSTLAALKRLGLIEEEKRWRSGTHMQEDRTWDTWTIQYRLTETGKEQIS
jgi:hypothetical protein